MICRCCGEDKPLGKKDWYVCRANACGYSKMCKECQKKTQYYRRRQGIGQPAAVKLIQRGIRVAKFGDKVMARRIGYLRERNYSLYREI